MANARQLVQSAWTMVETCYPVRLLRGAFLVAWGGPGAGKSTFLAKMLDSVPGPVLLVAAEEGLGPALSERLSRLGIKRRDFHVASGGDVDTLVDQLQQLKIQAVAFDSLSVCHLVPGELRKIQEASSVGLVAGTLQINKAGQAEGMQGWLHEADVVLQLEKMNWLLEKSRYESPGEKGEV